jgi:hypothetical protein
VAGLVCTGFVAGTGSFPRNLILNSSVESGGNSPAVPDHWTSSGMDASWSSTFAHTGSRSLLVNVTNASAEWISDPLAISGGVGYRISGFFEGGVTTGQFLFGIQWYSDSKGLSSYGGEVDLVSFVANNYSQWFGTEKDSTAPNGANSCRIFLKAVNGTGDLYGDDFEVRQVETISTLIDGVSLALIVYLISYYAIKSVFKNKVQKPQKLFTTGIGIYLLSWIVFWTLFYTVLAM